MKLKQEYEKEVKIFMSEENEMKILKEHFIPNFKLIKKNIWMIKDSPFLKDPVRIMLKPSKSELTVRTKTAEVDGGLMENFINPDFDMDIMSQFSEEDVVAKYDAESVNEWVYATSHILGGTSEYLGYKTRFKMRAKTFDNYENEYELVFDMWSPFLTKKYPKEGSLGRVSYFELEYNHKGLDIPIREIMLNYVPKGTKIYVTTIPSRDLAGKTLADFEEMIL